jgi:hypothetical protein
VRKIFSFSSSLPKAAAVALAGGMALLSGCGLGTVATDVTSAPAPVSGLQIAGTVHGASTPISGALVKLYVSGNGYGTGATLVGTSTRTAAGSGAFSFTTPFTSASCTSPASQIVYLTISGGDPTGGDASGGTNNHAILMASVLGTCSSLPSASTMHVSINEATTVAAAYALSGFTTVTSSAGGLASLSIGAPSTNTQGLLDAAANALLLVPTFYTGASGSGVAGFANSSTANILLPTATVNSLANIMTSCVNASDYTSYPCADQTVNSVTTKGLFTLATPPFGSAPSNVYQAFLNIAKYPGSNVPALLGLGSSFSLFQPTLTTTTVSSTTAPNDLTLGIGFPNGYQATGTLAQIEIALDKNDNVWLLGNSNGTSTTSPGYVSEIAASSTSGGPTFSLGSTSAIPGSEAVRWGAFDTNNNLWLTDGNDLDVFEIPSANVSSATQITLGTVSPSTFGSSSYTTTLTTENSAAIDPQEYVLAIDGSNNIWSATYGKAGNCLTSTSTATTQNDCNAVELPGGAGGTAVIDQFGVLGSKVYVNTPTVRGIFADANTNANLTPGELGNIWFTNYGVASATVGGTKTPGNTVQVLTPSTGSVAAITVGPTSAGLWGIALDKSSDAFVVSSTTTSTNSPALYQVPVQVTNGESITNVVPANAINGIPVTTSAPASSSTVNSSSTVAVPAGGLYTPANLAVDGAGNVWIANQGFSTLVEYSLTSDAYLSPYYGFSPSFVGTTLPITAYSVTTAGAGTFYTPVSANLTVGQTVTLSGFTSTTGTFLNGQAVTVLTVGAKNFTATVSNPPSTAVSKQPDTGLGTVTALPAQTLFTCSGANCGVTGGLLGTPTSVAIDRAGSVWTASVTNGMAVEIIGTAAPTDPVLADGKYGVLP